jgi:hypothetical protein
MNDVTCPPGNTHMSITFELRQKELGRGNYHPQLTTMGRNCSHCNNTRGQGDQRPPLLPTHDDDFVMNEAERGVGSGTTTKTSDRVVWGMGNSDWDDDQGQDCPPPPREPLPPQPSAFSSSESSQPRRNSSAPTHTSGEAPISWSSNIFRNTVGNVTASELRDRRRRAQQDRSTDADRDTRRPRRQRSPDDSELLGRVHAAGIEVPYHYDDEIPWEARSIIEDLLFQLDQKANETAHLHRKIEGINRSSRIRKRDDSVDKDRRPSKRRERSREEGSSYGPSPVVETRALELPAPGPSREDFPPQRGRSVPSRRQDLPRRALGRVDPTVINGRPYEPVIRVTPPGPLRPEPILIQQEARRHVSPPPPYDEDPYHFSESDNSDEEVLPVQQPDERSLRDDFVVPHLWGLAKVTNQLGREELERDNAMRNMLSRNAYYSRRSNSVFVGQSAQVALDHERRNMRVYPPQGPDGGTNHQVYERAPRGLPMDPNQVKRLRTLCRDTSRFSIREQVEAYLLLGELYAIANRVLPQHRDRSMQFLLEPNGFDVNPPIGFPVQALRNAPTLFRNIPRKPTQPPALSGVMNLDAVGLHMLYYNRPGGVNPIMGIAIDYVFRVGRRSVFGYALARLLSPADREAMHAFRRQLAFLMALPRRYREGIVEYNRAHPQSPFVAQTGPTYTLHRARLESSQAANINLQDAINVLVDNRVPPEWVDHAYPFGVITLNGTYTGSIIDRGLLDPLDSERLVRLHVYGEPAAIPEWDGWRNPTIHEVQELHDIMDQEAS